MENKPFERKASNLREVEKPFDPDWDIKGEETRNFVFLKGIKGVNPAALILHWNGQCEGLPSSMQLRRDVLNSLRNYIAEMDDLPVKGEIRCIAPSSSPEGAIAVFDVNGVTRNERGFWTIDISAITISEGLINV